MTQDEHIKYWLDSAQHDFDTLNTLFQSGKYDWSLFIGHIVLEKVLKAVYVRNNENRIPPKVHNLVRLAELSQINIDDDQKFLLDGINDFNIEVRYPEYKNEFYKICTKEFAEEKINQINKLYKWLKSQIK